MGKDFKNWGLKVRKSPEHNYHAVWSNLKTIRLGSGVAKELPPDNKEFYDVSLGSVCNLYETRELNDPKRKEKIGCDFCYVNASGKGKFFEDICGKAEKFFGNMLPENRPFQIAIGSTGEPTIHSDFIKFLETVYNLGIVPNYTTNSLTLARDDEYSKQLIEATKKYCGGVAISINKHTEGLWQKATNKLYDTGDVNINLHYIISDRKSVDNLRQIWEEYKDKVLYFVLLPLMPAGRSTEKFDPEAFEYLLEVFPEADRDKLAFGAHFYDEILKHKSKIKIWEYPPESLSANIILDTPMIITASSFSSVPVKTIEYEKI